MAHSDEARAEEADPDPGARLRRPLGGRWSALMAWIRNALVMPPEPLDDELRQRLLEVAKAVAAEHSWTWREPVEISVANRIPGKREWDILTNAMSRGCNIRMRIRESDFAVLSAGFAPR
jgi:hypothetical protein